LAIQWRQDFDTIIEELMASFILGFLISSCVVSFSFLIRGDEPCVTQYNV